MAVMPIWPVLPPMADDLFDYEGERSAAEAAAVLRELADGLEGGSVEFTEGEESVVIEVPDEVTLELELEREEQEDEPGEIELEVELEWETPGWTEVRSTGKDEGETGEIGAEGEIEEIGAEGSPEAENDEAESRVAEDEGAIEPDQGEEATGPEQLPEPAAPSIVQAPRGTSLARFQLFEDRAGEWRWRLVHRNGNIIATSGEGYTRRHNAEKGLRSVVANAPDAEVELEEE